MRNLLFTLLLACSPTNIPTIDFSTSTPDATTDMPKDSCSLMENKKELQKLYVTYKDCLECAIKNGTPVLCGNEFIMEWSCGEYTKIMFTSNSNLYSNYIFKGDTWVYGEKTNSGNILCSQGKLPKCDPWLVPIILCR